MKVNKYIAIVAILSLAVMQIFAMKYGINGTFRTIIVGAICGIAGLTQPIPSIFQREDKPKVVEVQL